MLTDRRNAQNTGRLSRRDLAEMLTQRLAVQVDELGLQILREIRKALDSVEIPARQTARDLH